VSRNHLRDALAISCAAVAWGVLSGVASIVVGIGASSTALVGTGADVLADVLSSVVLIWRFRAELHGLDAPEAVERRAQRVSSAALMIVAIVIGVLAAVRLATRQGASSGGAAIAVAVGSVVVLPVFALAKYRIGAAVPSPALRMDGHITIVGVAMSGLTLVGLALTSALGWSAADPAAAILIAAIALPVAVQGLRPN
jgi:divalent metal cation (Fe/Co/Zn/Cd) transporter